VAPIVAAGVLTVAVAVVSPRWCWIGLCPLLLYPMLVVKVARYRIKRGDRAADSLLYAASVVIGKFPQHSGVRKFRAAQKRGQQLKIIEYKGPAEPHADPVAAGRP